MADETGQAIQSNCRAEYGEDSISPAPAPLSDAPEPRQKSGLPGKGQGGNQVYSQIASRPALGADDGAYALPRLVYEPSSARYRLDTDEYATEDEAIQALAKSLGLNSEDAAMLLASQAIRSVLEVTPRATQSANALLGLIADAKPADSVEAMLIASMTVLHLKAGEAFSRATRAGFAQDPEKHLLLGAKLVKTQASVVEALTRYRRKGEQKVVVEHLTISDGGQAVVGNLNRG